MGCHGQIWNRQPDAGTGAAQLLLRPAVARGTASIDLPDFVYFNHSVHVKGGVGCVTCHGRVDQMALDYQVAPLTMGWCLDCHRDPEPRRRPLAAVASMTWSGRWRAAPLRSPTIVRAAPSTLSPPAPPATADAPWNHRAFIGGAWRSCGTIPPSTRGLGGNFRPPRRCRTRCPAAGSRTCSARAWRSPAGRAARARCPRRSCPTFGSRPTHAGHRERIRDVVDARWLRDRLAGRKSRGPADQDRGQPRASRQLGRRGCVRASARASVYDPHRARGPRRPRRACRVAGGSRSPRGATRRPWGGAALAARADELAAHPRAPPEGAGPPSRVAGDVPRRARSDAPPSTAYARRSDAALQPQYDLRRPRSC